MAREKVSFDGRVADNRLQKPKQYTLSRLGNYLFRYHWLLLLAVILTVGSNLLALVGSMLSGFAIDAIEPGAGNVEFDRVFYLSLIHILTERIVPVDFVYNSSMMPRTKEFSMSGTMVSKVVWTSSLVRPGMNRISVSSSMMNGNAAITIKKDA